MKNEISGEALPRHTAKSFLLAVLLGVFIGLAVIIPGISGSTVAIIFGMYASLLYAIGHIVGDFKRCFAYLFPIGIGGVVGFFGGFLVVQRVFENYMFILVCLFAGLMCGAFPAITAEVKGEKRSPLRVLLLCIGVTVPLIVGGISILLGSGSDTAITAAFSSFPLYLFLLYLPLGAAVSATQIIPGLSATAILMACGQFKPILASMHLDYILQNPLFIVLMLCLVAGFGIGIILISRGFSRLIELHRAPTFFLVVGLSLGSVISMFFNLDMWGIYTEWAASGIDALQLTVGAALLALGFAVSFALTKYELNRKA